MEFQRTQAQLFTSLTLYLSLTSLFLLFPPTHSSTTPAGTIQRTTKQQLLASIPPNPDQNSQPFLSSLSGKYTAYLLRHETSPGAGGYGNDFCYVQVQDATTGQGLWESDCASVSNVNTCSLVFSETGLEVFDGSRSAWNTGVETGNHLDTLELVDEGDMRISDRNGELAWKASDDPRANQACGPSGSPGLGYAKPPFASPVDGGRNLPFGQSSGFGGNQLQPQQQQQQQPFGYQQQQQQQQQPFDYQQQQQRQQPFGYQQQQQDRQNNFGELVPLDNTPFDSGYAIGGGSWFKMALAIILSLMANGLLF